MSIVELIHIYISKIEDFFHRKFVRSNAEAIFVTTLILFPILTRLTPFFLVSSVFVLGFILYTLNHFYVYANKTAKEENKQINTTEYSWGFVKIENSNFDFNNLVSYLKTKNIQFYKNYIFENKDKYIFMVFLFADLLVAFKNLPLTHSGAYFALSIFTKFVFMAFIYINKNNRETLANNIVAGQEDLETRTLDNFYKHFNGLASVSLVMFAIFFSFGRIFVDVFFGYDYLQYQTSLSFIFLANCTLLLGLLVFQTAYRLEPKRTFQIVKIFLVCISVLFVFMNINHPDTVAFFVIGSVLVLSIFLYNFSIRKPAYIERTYTALF